MAQRRTTPSITPSPHQQILFDDSDISIGAHNNALLSFTNETLNFYHQEIDIEVEQSLQLDFEDNNTSFRMHSDDSENDEETSNISLGSEIRTTASSNNTSQLKDEASDTEEVEGESSFYICQNLNKQLVEYQWKEIGEQANWTLSSAKQGNGIIQLRDNKLTTFWQSDGIQPHFVGIQFFKAVKLVEICIFLNFKEDESYTPQHFSIRVGSSLHDLVETHSFEVKEAQGWVCIPFGKSNLEPTSSAKSFKLVRFVQIAILGNHQNGRDTHIRQIKVFGIGNESEKLHVESLNQFGFQSANLDLLSHLK